MMQYKEAVSIFECISAVLRSSSKSRNVHEVKSLKSTNVCLLPLQGRKKQNNPRTWMYNSDYVPNNIHLVNV